MLASMTSNSLSDSPANSSIDRRFWGLDSAQSAELIRLYEDGKTYGVPQSLVACNLLYSSLAARRLNIQEQCVHTDHVHSRNN